MDKAKRASGLLILFLGVALLVSACMTTRTDVGQFREMRGRTYTYARGKQAWLFWGLIPLGRTSVNTPADGNCQVITRFTFGDILIETFTMGLVKTYSIRVIARQE